MKRVMPFGKYRGLPIKDIPPDYCHWLLNNGYDLEDDLVEGIKQALHGRRLEYLYERHKAYKKQKRQAKSKRGIVAAIAEQNLMAAQIIARGPYQGLMAEWAARILAAEPVRRRDPHWEAARAVQLGIA